MIQTLLIANRGEIACRIIRSCNRLGIASVAVYSEADQRAQHVKQASAAFAIGGAAPGDSYLRAERIIEAALKAGAQAIHPGFGFLSENAEFAEAVEQAGLIFVGPAAASMRQLGSKAGAKILMAEAGVPVVSGYTGTDQAPELLKQEAARIGFPLMIKAAHGGGGKGMRVVRSLDEFESALSSCQREARNAFGKDRVLLERYIETPRHIEFQIIGDAHGNLIHLNERECSVQRRYQKIFEETPSPFMTPELRTQMGEAAVRAGRAINYRNAGTVEFIVGAQRDFYFMEINTRLQVEHPVTEATLGIDLVEWQLKVASGERLPWSQDQVRAHGHAIEVRLYAEDPANQFLPSSGKLEVLRLPTPGPHVRLDSGVIEGDVVTVHYDPMIAKLIVHERDRGSALARLKSALADTFVGGIKSNIEFLETLIAHPKLIAGEFDTGYLDRALHEVLAERSSVPRAVLFAATLWRLREQEQQSLALARTGTDPYSPWAVADAWRSGHLARRHFDFECLGQHFDIRAAGYAGRYQFEWESQSHALEITEQRADRLTWLESAHCEQARVQRLGEQLIVQYQDQRFRLRAIDHYAAVAQERAGGNRVLAPMPGRVVALKASVGQSVQQGEELAVMEAMKMELSLKAPCAGLIEEIRARVGQFVEADALLISLKAS